MSEKENKTRSGFIALITSAEREVKDLRSSGIFQNFHPEVPKLLPNVSKLLRN